MLFAIALGLWIYVFLLIIGPFDSQPLQFHWRAQLMLGYGLVSGIVSWLTDRLLQHYPGGTKWSWWQQQFVFLVAFHALNFWPIYTYYVSDIVLGEWSFGRFLIEIYLATAVILSPFILAGRHFLLRDPIEKIIPSTIIMTGDNKLDILQLLREDLLYVKTAANYIEVYYLELGATKKKLLRTTLKQVAKDHSFLVRTHRSFLVNPTRITGWNASKVVSVGGEDIPVSTTYRASLTKYLSTHPQETIFRP